MKIPTLFWIVCLILFTACTGMAQAPHQIGGFELGRDISEVKDRVKMETALPIRYQEYLHQVEIQETVYFKSGLIDFANCATPGRIVRIKLKYSDSSKKFFDMLVKKYRERFGEPSEYRGDAFLVVIAHKWSFVDGADRISMTLQHNSRDEEEKMGNAVKLTLTRAIEEEQRCHGLRHPEKIQNAADRQGPLDWNALIPD